jgi:hypothetical protein
MTHIPTGNSQMIHIGYFICTLSQLKVCFLSVSLTVLIFTRVSLYKDTPSPFIVCCLVETNVARTVSNQGIPAFEQMQEISPTTIILNNKLGAVTS